MFPLRLAFLIALINSLLKSVAFAQQSVPDKLVESPAISYAKAVYYDKINVRKTVFSGPQYLAFSKLDYPYFQTDSARSGTIVYDGLTVNGVRLLYDIEADRLVMQYPQSPLQFLLDTTRIADFTLGGHTFHRFAADSTRPAGLATGFYDMLLPAEPLQLVVRRQKQRQEETREKRRVTYYLLHDKYYVIEQMTAVPIRRKKELYRLRPEKKKELVAFLRKSGLSFKNNKEAYLLAGVKYLNTIL